MARVAIVGAGVVGVASAWLLCRAGHEVTLVDRHAGPAQATSHANGAQLSYAYGDALASPSMLGHLPAIVLGRDPAYRVRLQADPQFLLWALRFLIEATPRRFAANTRHLLLMAAETQRLLPELMREFTLPFDHAASGKMILYRSAAACDAGVAARRLKQQLGVRLQVLDRAEATAIEPALDLHPDPIERVVYSEDDSAGRPDAFCVALVGALQRRYGLQTRYGREALAVESERGQVTGLSFADCPPLPCDWLVLATGSATSLLPRRERPLGGLWPVQGYSISAPATPAAMRVSITDLARKIVFARLGDEVRAAGLADIGSRALRFDGVRYARFRAACVEAFGGAFDHADCTDLRPWTGGRPCTPSSRPIVKASRLRGLFLNLGHGTLGWTLCLGSARRLMQIIAAAAPPRCAASPAQMLDGTACTNGRRCLAEPSSPRVRSDSPDTSRP